MKILLLGVHSERLVNSGVDNGAVADPGGGGGPDPPLWATM